MQKCTSHFLNVPSGLSYVQTEETTTGDNSILLLQFYRRCCSVRLLWEHHELTTLTLFCGCRNYQRLLSFSPIMKITAAGDG